MDGEKNEEKSTELNKMVNEDPNDLSAPNAGENPLTGQPPAQLKILPQAESSLLSSPNLRKRKTLNYHKINTGAPDSDDKDSSFGDLGTTQVPFNHKDRENRNSRA